MMLTLKNPTIQKLIDDRVRSGQYASAEDVVSAALISLEQQEKARDFARGELNELIAVGMEQIDRGEMLDVEDVFREIDDLKINAAREHE